MQATYKAFFDRMTSRYEGGYCWDAGDAGGPTKYGVTCFDLAAHRGKKMTSMSAWAPLVKAMTLAEAEDIYATRYAAPLRYNELPAGVDACMMDYGVNSGIGRVIPVVAGICGVASPSNRISDALLAAIHSRDADTLIDTIDRERMAFLRKLGNWRTFGGGWTARVTDLTKYCHALAKGTPAHEAPDLSNVATPKTSAPPIAPSGGKAAGGAVVAGGAVIASAAHWNLSTDFLLGAAFLVTVGIVLWAVFHLRGK